MNAYAFVYIFLPIRSFILDRNGFNIYNIFVRRHNKLESEINYVHYWN